MKTRHLFVLSMLASWGNALVVSAQTPAPADASAASVSSPAPAPATVAEKPKAARAVSDEVAASINATLPKYNPPPKAPEPKPEEELADLRDVDKPKNQIIRLPKYTVREQKSPVLRERDVYTKEGLAALAVRRYIKDSDRALNRFTLPLFGTSLEDRALAMYAEDERLSNMAELNDDAAMVSASDKAAGAYIKREAQKTYMRTSDFGWQGGPK